MPDFDSQNEYHKTFRWDSTFVPKRILVSWTALRTRGVDAFGGLSCSVTPINLTSDGFTLDLIVSPNVQYAAGKWNGTAP